MDDKMKKKIKQQLISLQEEIYKDIPSGFNFKVIMENIEGFLEDRPDLKANCKEICEMYSAAKDCATEDGEPYKDFNDYICKDLREGNIRDRILSQILTISYKLKIELKDMSLDIVTKTKKNKIYFMLRYIYNDLNLPKTNFVLPEGQCTPVNMNYLNAVKNIFECLEDYETTSLFAELIGGIEVMPITGIRNELMASLCQTPNFPCVKTKSIDSLIARLKEKIDVETDITLINATNGILDIMSFGKYDINGVGRMIDL